MVAHNNPFNVNGKDAPGSKPCFDLQHIPYAGGRKTPNELFRGKGWSLNYAFDFVIFPAGYHIEWYGDIPFPESIIEGELMALTYIYELERLIQEAAQTLGQHFALKLTANGYHVASLFGLAGGDSNG